MKKHVCLAISIFLLAVLPAEAQEGSGTYLTYVAGQTITETYTVSVEPDGAFKAEAEITIQGSKRKVVTRVAGARPVRFLAEIGGARHIVAEFSGATAKGAIGGQSFQKEIQSTVILENLVCVEMLETLQKWMSELVTGDGK